VPPEFVHQVSAGKQQHDRGDGERLLDHGAEGGEHAHLLHRPGAPHHREGEQDRAGRARECEDAEYVDEDSEFPTVRHADPPYLNEV
jgi:hypothetical protein